MRINEKTDNRLVLAEHPEYGIWYFTTEYKAAKYIGVQGAQVMYAILKNNTLKGWNFSVIEDGGDIPNKYINPTKH